MKKSTVLKFERWLRKLAKSYIIAISVFLNAGFLLRLSDSYTKLNMVFWTILFFFLFKNFFVDGLGEKHAPSLTVIMIILIMLLI